MDSIYGKDSEGQKNGGGQMVATPAETIYGKQNKSLHKAFTASGMPYNSNKEFWKEIMVAVVGRKVKGLTDMTLGERNRLIKHFKSKGLSLHNPRIYKDMWDWKKGDKTEKPAASERPIKAPGKQRMLKKIGAILAEHKLPWSYADKMAKKRFNVDRVEWLKPDDLKKIMQMLIIHNRRHGGDD